jgi:hypothetical protein
MLQTHTKQQVQLQFDTSVSMFLDSRQENKILET